MLIFCYSVQIIIPAIFLEEDLGGDYLDEENFMRNTS